MAKGGKYSRDKGKRGELQWRDWLKENLGLTDAKRGYQARGGGEEASDVENGIHGTHPEVKNVERLNIWAAMAQASQDSHLKNRIPYVVFKRNRSPWVLAIEARFLIQFALKVVRQALLAGKLTMEDIRAEEDSTPDARAIGHDSGEG